MSDPISNDSADRLINWFWRTPAGVWEEVRAMLVDQPRLRPEEHRVLEAGSARGRATRKAVARANGRTVESRPRREADGRDHWRCQGFPPRYRWPALNRSASGPA